MQARNFFWRNQFMVHNHIKCHWLFFMALVSSLFIKSKRLQVCIKAVCLGWDLYRCLQIITKSRHFAINLPLSLKFFPVSIVICDTFLFCLKLFKAPFAAHRQLWFYASQLLPFARLLKPEY